MTQPRLGWLDALRGYAALVVVYFHLGPTVLGPDRHMAIYRHIDLGKYGVLLFFLVSGYVIPLSLERHGCLRRFWIGRLFRVYPAYLATIGAAALLGAWHGGVLAHSTMLLDPLGQRGAVRVFWTLSYEMIFYLVVAGLFAWRLHRHSAWWAAGLAVTAVVLGPVLPDGLLGSGRTVAAALLLLMAVGIAGHLAGRHRLAGVAGIGFLVLPAVNGHPTADSTVAGSRQALLLLAVLFAGTVIYRAQHGGLGRWPAGVTLAVVAAALVVAQPRHALWAATVGAVAGTFALAFAARRRPMPRLLGFLGTVSYSLYLTHVLVLLVVGRLMPGLAQRPAGVRVAAGVAVVALALAVAWAAHRTIERPGQRLGRWIATERAAPRTGRGEKRRGERLVSMQRERQRAADEMGQGMSVRRIMGTEVEYGISVPGQPGANPMVTSSQVVNAYGARPELNRGGRARWDYEEESPLRDARGFTYSGAAYDPADALADEDLGLANVILTNGARLYVDHAHPEYSTPECTNPLDVVCWDKAGERVMAEASRRAATIPGAHRIQLYKNNTDNKGASYGSHENYLMRRQTPFADIVAHLTPFFVTRQIFCGAGRVGIGQDGSGAGFQISSRADFFEVEVGLETTLKRPIINTRDEPHSDADKYRRLHVIIGDANLSEVATYLKVGTTALVLSMIEDKVFTGELGIADPVSELKAVSHDPALGHLMRLRDGRRLTALDLQWAYYERARAYVDERYGADVDDQTAEVLRRWESVLDRLGRDPMLCSDELDWVAKLRLLEGYRDRENLAWSSPKLQLVDLQYADVRPEKGLYHRLVARGSMKTLLDDAQTRRAMVEPPDDTRAYFRGRCLAQYASEVVAASWDSVIFDVGRESLVRVPMMEPERGTRKHVGALFDKCESAKDLLEVITSR